MKTKLLSLVLILAFVCIALSGCSELFGEEITEFSAADKERMNERCGFELPFINCGYYELEDQESGGLLFVAFGYTEENYNNYVNNVMPEHFTSIGDKVDSMGNTWHEYSCGEWNIAVGNVDIFFMEYLNVYIYSPDNSPID
jgi:hypothetical protein